MILDMSNEELFLLAFVAGNILAWIYGSPIHRQYIESVSEGFRVLGEILFGSTE